MCTEILRVVEAPETERNFGMSTTIEIPSGVDLIEYLSSFAPAFAEKQGMRAALLGMKDSLRQASLFPLEPLALFACLTAEEEAATFLYFALREKGYRVPDFGRLHRHPDKVRVLVFAQAIFMYYFKHTPDGVSSVVRVDRDGAYPKVSRHVRVDAHELHMVQDDPLTTVITLGEGEAAHEKAILGAVDKTMDEITPKGFTIESHIKNLANRRNLSIYGDPAGKPRLKPIDGIAHFKSNCTGIVVLGFMVFNGSSRTPSMEKLVEQASKRFLEGRSRRNRR